MNNFLAIDTSSRYLTVLAKKGENIVLRHLPECAMKHSVILMDEIENVFSEANLLPEECDFFAAVTGPGSFTGIRIGIATVKGFMMGTGKPLVSITSFDMIAYNVKSKSFCVVIDAAHGHYYVKGYGVSGFPEPRYMSEREVLALGLPLYGFESLPLENYTKLNVQNCLLPAVLASGNNLSYEMNALYVRKSQAEEARIQNGTA